MYRKDTCTSIEESPSALRLGISQIILAIHQQYTMYCTICVHVTGTWGPLPVNNADTPRQRDSNKI